MKIHWGFFMLTGIIWVTLFTGCVNDNTDDCVDNTGINIRIYSRNSCQTDSVYPETIDNLLICIFNKEDVLTAHKEISDVELNSNWTTQMEIPPGLYTVIIWSGLTQESIELIELNNGSTHKNDLLFRLRMTGNRYTAVTGNPIYMGESSAVYIAENKTKQPLFEEVAVNITEITNRITIIVEGIPAEYFEIAVETSGSAMNVDGSYAASETLEQMPDYLTDAGVLEAGFTLLKLVTGNNTSIIVRDITPPEKEEIFRGDLLGTLLFKNPEVNLACDHDFTIRFTAEDQCNCGTYTITEIWVNNWLVHSYETEM